MKEISILFNPLDWTGPIDDVLIRMGNMQKEYHKFNAIESYTLKKERADSELWILIIAVT